MFYENLLKLCQERNEQPTPLLKKLGISTGGLANWRNGVTPGAKTLSKIADYFGVSVEYLLGRPQKFPQEFSENEMYSFQVIGTIAAGFDGVAQEEYTGEDLIVPPHLVKTRNPDDYFVLQIKGDSMFPLLEDGDKVLIRRCSTVDSGTVAAIGFNGEQATVKKVEYIQGEDWLRLVPRNPEYPVKTIRGADLNQCRIYGEVVYLFRDKISF